MPWYWILFFLFAAFIIVLLITNTKMELLVVRNGDKNDYIAITLKFLYFITIKQEIPMVDIANRGGQLMLRFRAENLAGTSADKNGNITFDEIKRIFDKFHEIIKRLHNVKGKIKDILGGFHVVHFQWYTKVGIKDAAILAPVIGGIWTVKGLILNYAFYLLPLCASPSVHVDPDYQENFYKTQLHCIFQFKVGYAIYAGVRFLYLYMKGVRHV